MQGDGNMLAHQARYKEFEFSVHNIQTYTEPKPCIDNEREKKERKNIVKTFYDMLKRGKEEGGCYRGGGPYVHA
jgi:hypothetical protein